jgi:hypothetical protein
MILVVLIARMDPMAATGTIKITDGTKALESIIIICCVGSMPSSGAISAIGAIGAITDSEILRPHDSNYFRGYAGFWGHRRHRPL